jgi:hypothetical protein
MVRQAPPAQPALMVWMAPPVQQGRKGRLEQLEQLDRKVPQELAVSFQRQKLIRLLPRITRLVLDTMHYPSALWKWRQLTR